jgi:hypothetical protein
MHVAEASARATGRAISAVEQDERVERVELSRLGQWRPPSPATTENKILIPAAR